MPEEMFDADKSLGNGPEIHRHEDADDCNHAQKLNQGQGVLSMLPGYYHVVDSTGPVEKAHETTYIDHGVRHRKGANLRTGAHITNLF